MRIFNEAIDPNSEQINDEITNELPTKPMIEYYYESALTSYVNMFVHMLTKKLEIDTSDNEKLIDWLKTTKMDLATGSTIIYIKGRPICSCKLVELTSADADPPNTEIKPFRFMLTIAVVQAKDIELCGFPPGLQKAAEKRIGMFMSALNFYYKELFLSRTKLAANIEKLETLVDLDKYGLKGLANMVKQPVYNSICDGFYYKCFDDAKLFPMPTSD